MITSTWHILALVLAIGSAFMFYYLITIIIQLKSTIKTVETMITSIKSDIKPVISNVEGITGNFETMTDRADDMFKGVQDKTSETMNLVDDAKIKVSNIQNILKYSIYLILNRKVNQNKNIYVQKTSSVLKPVNSINIVDHLGIQSK